MIRNKLTSNSQSSQRLFSQDDLREPQVEATEERQWGGDDDMNEFDRLM